MSGGTLIVGASQAGLQLAVSLRERGDTAPITLIGAPAWLIDPGPADEGHFERLEFAQHPVRRLVTGEAGQQTAAREALELAHDLTAPAVSPKAIRLCTRTKNATTGNAVSVAPAISEPQSVPRRVVKFASQIVRVCLLAVESRT